MGLFFCPFGGLVSCVKTFLGVSSAVSCCVFTLGSGLHMAFNDETEDSGLWDEKSNQGILWSYDDEPSV
ncbi:hypothetical protein BFJ63_vAg7636 [Fusarium oxysporum f. sp. narcissi]|uniref:Uncharacterized protein n=4 Tax=Fusarium oxysporum TaxID=5507 RepID=A0A2H3GRB9_FUSOX|nr:uncharacterized protein FOBCDRAFT_323106 [Fusarium oxysporum Fo47]KAJ4140501.1 hypothetical protein NW765_015773 [Fusarium oxysporum]PCD29324.1 hypothetical protein AU210_011862 [Fusarium oxysporum f. sp. radicis-cucumerinum]RKK12964.1 hypothetical protein BFJ65_g12216 [Fusarium oxysporum f. sp. cepae]RYC89602.1 hypothetical protein BFJ63_vAg7636 [Fusarium oxysporum f. sp. narcissi]KAJ4277833.1 hypothetical protein NW764_007866 [Fusarium oxysporum]